VKVLALTHRLPYAPDRGDRIRSYHLLRKLAGHADVHLFSLVDRRDASQVDSVRSWLSSVTVAVPPLTNFARAALSFAGTRPLTHILLSAPAAERTIAQLAERVQPDVVLTYCSGMAHFAVDGPLRHLPCVLDMVDVDSFKWKTLGESVSSPMRWVYRREARVLGDFEVRATRHAAVVLVVNAREKEALETIAPGAPIVVIGNGIDANGFAPTSPASESSTVVFCGVMDYPPNVEAVLWFVQHVWPAVRREIPDATFTIVGAQPARSIARLHGVDGIAVSGKVSDVRPFLWRAAVSVAPLLTARGIQNKVLEALAAGLPVVVTRTVAAGLPAVAHPGCRIVDDPGRWADSVVELLRASPAERRRLSQLADLKTLTWEASLRDVPSILEAAAAQGRRSPP
jgi:sugar transferase (PEP-CTERM/EpsH1 system associated)